MAKHGGNVVVSKLKKTLKKHRKKFLKKKYYESQDEKRSKLVDNNQINQENNSKLNRWKARIILFLIALLLLVSGSLHIYMGVKSKDNIKNNISQLHNNVSRIIAMAPSLDIPPPSAINETEAQSPSSTTPTAVPNSDLPPELNPQNSNTDPSSTRLGAWAFGNPYNSLIWMGSIILLIGLTALYGCFSLSPQVLFGYYVSSFVIIPLLIYLSCFCFLFASDQKAYVEILNKYVKITKGMDDLSDIFLTARLRMIYSGILSLFTSIVTAIGIWSSSTLIGHDYAVKRLSMSMNLVTIVFGTFLFYLAIVASQADIGGWVSILIAVAGFFTILISLLGYYGLAKQNKILLIFHSFSLCLIGSLMLIGCISSFVLKSHAQYVLAHWVLLKQKYTIDDVYTSLSNHILLIGVGSALVLFCMIVNLTTSIFALKSICKRKKRLGDSELALSDYKKIKQKNKYMQKKNGQESHEESEDDDDDDGSEGDGEEEEEEDGEEGEYYSEENHRPIERRKSKKEERRKKLMEEMLNSQRKETKRKKKREDKKESNKGEEGEGGEDDDEDDGSDDDGDYNDNDDDYDDDDDNDGMNSDARRKKNNERKESKSEKWNAHKIDVKVKNYPSEKHPSEKTPPEKNPSEKHPSEKTPPERNPSEYIRRISDKIISVVNETFALSREERDKEERRKNAKKSKTNLRWFENVPGVSREERSETEGGEKGKKDMGRRTQVEAEEKEKEKEKLPAWERRKSQSEKTFVMRMKKSKQKRNFFDK